MITGRNVMEMPVALNMRPANEIKGRWGMKTFVVNASSDARDFSSGVL